MAQGHQGQSTISHAMVLDLYDEDQDLLIFKNTFESDGQTNRFTIERIHPNAPKELFFVHVEIRDIGTLSLQGKKEAEKFKKQMEQQYSVLGRSDSESFESSTSETDDSSDCSGSSCK